MNFKKIETIKSYNQTASQYRSIVNSFSQLPEIVKFAKLIKDGGKILDLGCGPGHHSKYFSDLGFEVVGIDLSEKMISLAEESYKNIDFQVMDIENISFKKKSFDGIWASASLLHIEKKNLPNVLVKLKNILKKNGNLYISLKVGSGEEILKDNRYSGVTKFYSFFQFFEIKKFLRDSDLKIFEINFVDQRDDYDTNNWMHLFIKKS